jgi:anthranilate synthase component II
MATPHVLLIDNYDSFTWNLVHYFGALGARVDVHRNDKISVADVLSASPDALVLSPGPCTPHDAGICLDLIRAARGRIPLFGVCLGHQAIGAAYGGDVIRAPQPMHGKISTINHDSTGLFAGISGPFRATRYHSLIVDQKTLPHDLHATAHSEDGLIMALEHATDPIYGVQFHPESIESEHGMLMLDNFLNLAAAWNKTNGRPTKS